MQTKGHITAFERDQIGVLLASGISLSRIARKLGRSKSSISYEVSRNSRGGAYHPILANRVSRDRNLKARRLNPAKDPGLYADYVVDKLRSGWSPEQMTGRLRKKNHGTSVISYETIYKYIYSEAGKKQGLAQYLPRAHHKRWKKHSRKYYHRGIPNRVNISLRPEEINHKNTFGHWEADVVEGRAHKLGIQTFLERKTRFYQTRLLPKIDSEFGVRAQKYLLSRFPAKARLSVTFDNGRENYNHEQLQKDLNIETYFCDPYSAWQKGSNEYHNGLLRRYIPKGSDLTNLPQWELDLITEEINNRPRKCLNFATPKEAFLQEIKDLLLSNRSDSF